MIKLLLPAVFVCALTAAAEDYPEFADWMKATDKANAELTKMDQKVGPQAARAAEVMGGVYENMIEFFRQYGGENAIKWSENGKAAAAALASAAFANDPAAADTAFKALSGTCRSCHNAYREKDAGGKFHFKRRTEPAAAPAKPAERK